mgnify:CR=1 FL=1
MTISIQRLKSKYAYMIKPDDPCQIWVRRNAHNVRWQKYGPPFGSAESARDALLRLDKDAKQ